MLKERLWLDATAALSSTQRPLHLLEPTPLFEGLLMQLNTETTADPYHQSAGALPIYCTRTFTRHPQSVTKDAVDIPMHVLAQERTDRALTARHLKSIPAFFSCAPPLPGHRRSLAALRWKHEVESGDRLGSPRAVRSLMLAMCSARSSFQHRIPKNRQAQRTPWDVIKDVWTLSMSELMYLGLPLTHTCDCTSTALPMLYSISRPIRASV